MWCI